MYKEKLFKMLHIKGGIRGKGSIFYDIINLLVFYGMHVVPGKAKCDISMDRRTDKVIPMWCFVSLAAQILNRFMNHHSNLCINNIHVYKQTERHTPDEVILHSQFRNAC